jgi:hypothetical protein
MFTTAKFAEAKSVKLKTFEELEKEFGSFLNKEYYDSRTIEIKCENGELFYVDEEYNSILGTRVDLYMDRLPDEPYRWVKNSNMDLICEEMVVKGSMI